MIHFTTFRISVLSSMGILFAQTAAAHHGASAHVDLDQQITIVGTVDHFERINPHSFLYVNVPSGSKQAGLWQCELKSQAIPSKFERTRAGVTIERAFLSRPSLRTVAA